MIVTEMTLDEIREELVCVEGDIACIKLQIKTAIDREANGIAIDGEWLSKAQYSLAIKGKRCSALQHEAGIRKTRENREREDRSLVRFKKSARRILPDHVYMAIIADMIGEDDATTHNAPQGGRVGCS